jgi:hypothetical protein
VTIVVVDEPVVEELDDSWEVENSVALPAPGSGMFVEAYVILQGKTPPWPRNTSTVPFEGFRVSFTVPCVSAYEGQVEHRRAGFNSANIKYTWQELLPKTKYVWRRNLPE